MAEALSLLTTRGRTDHLRRRRSCTVIQVGGPTQPARRLCIEVNWHAG